MFRADITFYDKVVNVFVILLDFEFKAGIGKERGRIGTGKSWKCSERGGASEGKSSFTFPPAQVLFQCQLKARRWPETHR